MQNKITTRVLVLLAMLVAVSIILGKYLAFNAGEVLRFSAENLPVILAGIVFGPVAGVLTGVVADLVGCLMVGYTVNPLVTVGAGVIGAISGLLPMLLARTPLKENAVRVITVASAHLVGSVLIKTLGLASYYEMPYAVLLLWRLLNYVIIGGLEGFILISLLNSRGVKQQLAKFKEERK